MYHKILIPLAMATPDDSLRPLAEGRALAAPGAAITVLHVIEDVPAQAAAYLPPQYLAEMQAARLADLSARVAGIEGVTPEVAHGNAAATILERAEALGCDCVVIASHRPGGLRDWLIGSTAARVVRHAQCSVLVIR